MLFDEKDYKVFDNPDSRKYFKEILQSYYCQNYRATIVLLYSFVIYDLFTKLQTMANEGDKKAASTLNQINLMIVDDEKYSTVENVVINFFKSNCQLYFNNFIEDIDYLKNCRNKCAHLKVNDNSLYVPSDYHARMLICSMYDHILSVKAPFIMDLLSFAEQDIEYYSESISTIPRIGLDSSIKQSISEKYLKRMTYNSLKRSYKTFTKLLLISNSEDSINNVNGLFAFVYTMTDYAIKTGHSTLFSEDIIINTFSKINIETLQQSPPRLNALIALISLFPNIMDIVRGNEDVFSYICERVLKNPDGLSLYKTFFPQEDKSVYSFFKETISLHCVYSIEIIYDAIKDCDDFNFAEFAKIMAKSIPTYNGFNDADIYMVFFKKHLSELSDSDIGEILEIYRSNNQCTNRSRDKNDMVTVEEYLKYHNTPEEENNE